MRSFVDYVNKSELLKGWKTSGAVSCILAGFVAYAQYEANLFPPDSFVAFVFGALAITIPKWMSEAKSLQDGEPAPSGK